MSETRERVARREEARRYRAKRRAHPEQFTCDCSRRGAEVRGNAVVCARCAAWEDTYYRRHAGYRGG
jgi:hypothetical protein